MFPYPSGRIHMGHVRNYTMGDVVARYKRARGFDVLHPMGWDAFGLPAENAAFERGVHPAEWTYGNIATMRGQLRMMGLSIDWEREFATCHPGYYEHQQALFLDFFEAGLVERKEAWVNWDPVDRTVLANEQVVDGRGWRSGAPVEKRRLAQWFLRITRYADELLEALEALPRWPDKVRLMQRNWIGRSEGARILFPVEGRDEALEVFTTRPDTLFGASFCALSPNHPLATALAASDPALAAFIDDCNLAGIGERDIEAAGKRGHDTGLRVRHPFAAERTLPLYVANFVLMDYGTGAIFGCPAHDQRDLDFARSQGLPVRSGGVPAGRGRGCGRDRRRGLRRRRHRHQLRLPERACGRGRQGQRRRGAGGARPGRQCRQLPPARLGHLAAALLGLPDPDGSVRELRRGAGAARGTAGAPAGGRDLRQARQSPRPSSDVEAHHLSRDAAARR